MFVFWFCCVFPFYLLVNELLELIIPTVGVSYLFTAMLLVLVHPEAEVMVTSTVPWDGPDQETSTTGLAEDPVIVPLIAAQLNVWEPGSTTE